MAKPKYDYKSVEFLARLTDFAKRGLTDGEIADALGLNRTYFTEKKSSVAEISEALSRARSQINGVVRAAFLKAALGGRMVKTVRYSELRCDCRGKDPDCPECKGTGWIPDGERITTETELPPNLAAQQRWLMNYDSDWLKRTRGESEGDLPTDVATGVDIEEWLKKELESGGEPTTEGNDSDA